jgi:hypothetical protein
MAHRGERTLPAQPVDDLEAIDVGQHHIKNDERVAAAGGDIDRAGAGVVEVHLEAVGEAALPPARTALGRRR